MEIQDDCDKWHIV